MTVKSRFNCCLQPLNMRENPPSGAREDCFFSSIIRISNVLHSRNTRASWIKLEHRCQYAFQQNTLLSKLVHTFQSQYLCLRPHWWVYGLKFLSLERKLQGGEGFFFFRSISLYYRTANLNVPNPYVYLSAPQNVRACMARKRHFKSWSLTRS